MLPLRNQKVNEAWYSDTKESQKPRAASQQKNISATLALLPFHILHTVSVCLVKKSLGKRGLKKAEARRRVFSKKWEVTLTICSIPPPPCPALE